MDITTANYIIQYFPRLLNAHEKAAMQHYYTSQKLGTPDRYSSVEQYAARAAYLGKYGKAFSDDPDVLRLLEHGPEQLYINAALRIVTEQPEKVYFNYCVECGKLARLPYARQCRYCGHAWHHTAAGSFRMKKIFELPSRPGCLFFAGGLKAGIAEAGMRLDLTFLGVAIKPVIVDIGFADDIATSRSDMVLAAKIDEAEDRSYLLERGVLAIGITIEY